MTNAESFMALPPETRAMFERAASGNDHTAYEWFISLVPEPLRDNPDEIDVFMNGGEITLVNTVGDRGVAGGGYTETDTITMPDRDMSHVVSDHNGGPMSTDNVVMENMHDNRSRGSDNMTDTEHAHVMETNEIDAELIDGSIIGDTHALVAETESVTESVLDGVLDGLLPATVAATVGMHVASKFDDPIDRWGFGSGAAGLTVLACLTPPGQLALGGYAAWNLGKLAHRGIKWLAA